MLTAFDGKSSSDNGNQFIFMDGQPDPALFGRLVATVHEDTEKFGEWTPLTRLFLAAPDLLAACEAVAKFAREGYGRNYSPDAKIAVIDQVVAAINQAKGV